MVIYQGNGYALENGPEEYVLRAPDGRSITTSHELMESVLDAAFRVRRASYGQVLAAAWTFITKG